MPHTCFSYPSDVPPGASDLNAVPQSPRDPQGMGYPCFSYPFMCFSYPPDAPPGVRNRGAAPMSGLRRMPYTCFTY